MSDSIERAKLEFPELGEFFDGLAQMRAAILATCEVVRSLAPERQQEFQRGIAGIALAMRRCAEDLETAARSVGTS